MRARLSAIVLASIFMSACATSAELARTPQEDALAERMQSRSIVPATAEERNAVRNQDLLAQAAFWAEAYDLNPGDREAAYELSNILRRLGGAQRAAEIARQALALYPEDAGLLTSYGMALTASGAGAQAVEPLSRAIMHEPSDWRLTNALGVALEQAGRPDRARTRFAEAVALAPGEPAVLNNLALNRMLGGDPEEAERILRRAMDIDHAGPQVRQNLALALALQGRFSEAEDVALLDSTPEMAEANLGYVRALMSNNRNWDSLRQAASETRN